MMFNGHDNLPMCHDLDGKHRTSDVILEEKITFSTLLLKEELQKGLLRCGYVYLSPIQRNALPVALTGTSIIAHAKSGTGKSLVYILPVLNNVLERKQQNLVSLILSPTREIAKQIYDVMKSVGYYIQGLKVEYFIGGTPLDLDVLKCKGCQVAIGAPGRIKHLIELGELETKNVQILVLDEVDALLSNKEFAIRELASFLPSEKQTIVCTATFSDYVKRLLVPISTTIKYITVTESTSSEQKDDQITSNILIGIKQFIAPVVRDNTAFDIIRKRNKLIEILRNFKYDQCFVFVNYVTIAKGLCNLLVGSELPALWVSSEQDQSTRISTLNKLKLNQCNILVTTDLACRGIDVHNVNLVINMGIPSPPDVYIHRMGRAGRYGSEGAVITILHEGFEMEQFCKLVSSVSTDPVDLYILPDELSENFVESSLQKTRCEPDPGSSINNNEYRFKKNNEKQINGNGKKKSKKSKKKNKRRNGNSSRQRGESNSMDELEISVNESILEDITVDKEMETMIEQYIQSFKEEVYRDVVVIDEENLRNIFKPPENTIYAVAYEDFFRPRFIEIPKRNFDDDDDVFIETIDDASLKQYMIRIKRKHEFLDEQKLPCSILQFLKLYSLNKNALLKHVSVNVRDSVREIIGKISYMLTGNRSETSSATKSTKTKNFSGAKTVNQIQDSVQPSDASGSQDNELRFLDEDYQPPVYPGPWIPVDDSPLIENIADDPISSHSEPIFVAYQSVPTHQSNKVPSVCDNESYQSFFHPGPQIPINQNTSSGANFVADRINNRNNVPRMSSYQSYFEPLSVDVTDHVYQNERNRSTAQRDPLHNRLPGERSSRLHGTCPNCQHNFSGSRSNRFSFLLPISNFVDENMEKRIWQHHMNFINLHKRNPIIFGNL